MIRAVDRFTGRARRMRDSARRVQSSVSQPTPPVKIVTGPVLPAWVLQLLLAGCAAAAVIILDPPIFGLVVLIGCIVVVAVRPNPATAGVFVGALGFFWLVEPTRLLAMNGYVIIALAVATWVFAGALSALPLRARVELAVLRRPLLRWLLLGALGEVFLLAGQVVQAGPGPDRMAAGAVVLAAAVVLTIAVWVILPRLSLAAHEVGPGGG